MASIIDHIDRADARVTNWLDSNYPTFIYKLIAFAAWVVAASGAYLVSLSYWYRSAYNVFAGLFFAVVGTACAALLTLWARNEIAALRHKGRRAHPSYPYKVK